MPQHGTQAQTDAPQTASNRARCVRRRPTTESHDTKKHGATVRSMLLSLLRPGQIFLNQRTGTSTSATPQ